MHLGRTKFNPAMRDKIILHTLPISHYVEKVRWYLDYAGIEYEEEQDIGLLNIILCGRSMPTLEVPSKGVTISNSSDILRYLYSVNLNNGNVGKFLGRARRPSGSRRFLTGSPSRTGGWSTGLQC